ncbi:zinc finger CCCH domain-containing protein 7A isoform X1 [Astyanax mexicanus]|uniref:Zinc finger CCCH domain-containing protein 7A isoform X1 n=1 Tax=Astyanax mexicanus TaxID=7994 RepID=A0A8B9KIL8_ASTMX|nr:zinc finger CCCH domain-containing protein 7A isoform X1 [Astyanax mexicanus]
MSSVGQDRSSRWQEIEKGLQFIQSTLPFPGGQEQYEIFIQDLVRNLFGEGNDVFHEGEWARSVELYTEALNIAEYADSEDILIACELREKLHANRAASYLNIGLHDQALVDCEKALQLNDKNHRALYRKARSLKEMGRHQDAYEAVAKCSMAVPQDTNVIQLTQELAKMLGLKIRKAYVRGKPALNVLSGSSISGAANEKQSQTSASVEDIETDACHSNQAIASSMPVSMPLCPPVSEKVEVEPPPPPAPVNIMPPVPPIEPHNPEPNPMSVHMPLVNGSRPSESYAVPEPQLDFDAEIIGDDLDELLDAAPADPSVVIPTVKGPLPLPTSIASVSSMSASLHLPPLLSHPMLVATQCTVNLPAPYNKPVSSSYSLGLDTFASPLDSLDSLSISEPQSGFGQHTFMIGSNEITLPPMPPMGMPFGMPESSSYAQELPPQVDLAKNPLADTHEFKQACSTCFRTGPGVLDFSYHPEDHKCKKDLLLGRLKHSDNLTWKLIRPRPTKNQYVGPYYICKDVANGEECKYRGHCTFAYCQEEIDVWTLERKGFISRDLLCDPYGARMKVTLSVPKILQEHQGIFMFLCQVCFDHKPRIISKLNKDNPAVCSHPVTKHVFEEHKCLVHVLKDVTLSYSKIRPYFPTCQLDLCRHAVRYGCQREDYCFYAHSLIELKVWVMQREQGITHESIVQEAKKFWNIESNSQVQELQLSLKKFGPSNLKMQFVCEQCWRNGQVSEPDKNRKYCSAKARHIWSKDRQVVLVSSIERRKWIQMRSLPTRKPAPSQFEICMHVAAGKKCQYIGNCTFAHSPEEKDLWTYMKDNNIADMGQLYELWLQSQKPSCSAEGSSSSTKENGKQIHLPTDYAEEMAGNHCWLCGKNCNSEKQWQQHITSEKHKDRVFNSEDDLNCWQYRFPTGTFKVCERFRIGTCTEEELCKLAHGEEELKEWQDRREFLLQRLAKARNDHLLAPNDNDFGKYSFLLKDLK